MDKQNDIHWPVREALLKGMSVRFDTNEVSSLVVVWQQADPVGDCVWSCLLFIPHCDGGFV